MSLNPAKITFLPFIKTRVMPMSLDIWEVVVVNEQVDNRVWF